MNPTVDPEQLTDELDQLAQQRAADHERRKQARDQLRAELAECRRIGKARRHARRLAAAERRLREATTTGPDDSWWEEPDGST